MKGPNARPLNASLTISSTIDSFTICVSEKRKMVGVFLQPASIMKVFRSSRHALLSYFPLTSMFIHFMSHIDADMRAREERPEPPTPTRSAQPRGWQTTREMRAR